MNRIAVKVIIFGVGGVGSWCAESLVRSGSKQTDTGGFRPDMCYQRKPSAHGYHQNSGAGQSGGVKERLDKPSSGDRVCSIYSEETADSFELDTYDYIARCHWQSGKTRFILFVSATLVHRRGLSLRWGCIENGSDQDKCSWIESEGFQQLRCAGDWKRGKTGQKFAVYSEGIARKQSEATVPAGTAACLCPKTKTVPADPELVNHEWCSKRHASTERWLTPPPFLVLHWPASSWKIFMLPSADPFWSAYSPRVVLNLWYSSSVSDTQEPSLAGIGLAFSRSSLPVSEFHNERNVIFFRAFQV